jgi:hypothetical protein
MRKKIDKTKVFFAICIVLWSVLGSYLGQPLIHGNQDAINVIVTVFSILAGFLVAVITLIGDPSSLPSGSWQVARLGSDLTYNRLVRHKWLFKAYLLTLMLIFISIVIKSKYQTAQVALEYIYMFFATAACLLSFKLPSALIELQQERIEQEIEERRKKDNIE